MGLQPLRYLVLVPVIGAAHSAASGAWLVQALDASRAVVAARAKCLRPIDYDWTRATAGELSTVEDCIRKGL